MSTELCNNRYPMQYSATWRDKTGTVRWRNKSNWDFYEDGWSVRSASSDNGDEEPTTTMDGWAARMCGMTKPDDSGVGYATSYANRNSFNPYKRTDQMDRDYKGESSIHNKKNWGGARRNKSKMRKSRKGNKSKKRKSRKTNRRR
jgi:hypothetical protein